ncbi:MAG: hypothetical protein ACO1OB_20760 [Archangium sp.]
MSTTRVEPETLRRVIAELLGFSSLRSAGPEEERRLAKLLARVKKAGADLMPLFQSSLDEVEQEACDLGRREVRDRLDELILEDLQSDTPPRSGAVRGVKSYAIEVRVTGVQATFIARGTGPMKGDVLSTELGHPTVTCDLCATKRGPPLGSPRPARKRLAADAE